MEKGKTIFTASEIEKHFGGIRVLHKVSLELLSGEILGLIGENGSGKSTLSAIISGMHQRNGGQMVFNGKSWEPESMVWALENGIGMIVQESGTVPGITVAENIFLADLDRFKKGPCVDKKTMFAEAQDVLDKIGATNISASAITGSYDIQSRKLIEIARVMRKVPQILIVDETSTALSHDGRNILYNIMNRLKASGRSVIFISHDMDEIMNICDRLTVLRDGKIIRSFTKDEYDENEIKENMIGRKLDSDYYRNDWDDSCSPEVVLEGRNLNVGGSEPLIDFNIQLHKGEIVGIGGLSQCGMHTLGKVLFGAMSGGNNASVTTTTGFIKDEKDAMSKGIAYVSKNRDTESLVLNDSIENNIAAAGLDKFSVGKFLITGSRKKKYTQEQVDSLKIKCVDRKQYVSGLSGGNKQKVVFGKWIARGSDILILDCPTRGIDIGIKQAMYRLMIDFKKQGKSILIISEEMGELLGMSDRIIVMKDGKQMTELHRHDKPQESDIIKYMI